MAPITVVAERKPGDLANSRMVTSHRTNFNKIASQITTNHRPTWPKRSKSNRQAGDATAHIGGCYRFTAGNATNYSLQAYHISHGGSGRRTPILF